MTTRQHLAAALSALMITTGCGTPTPNPLKTSEPAMPPTPTSDPPSRSGTPKPKPKPDLAAEKRAVRSVVERYVAAITARDEPTAAHDTCQKKDGGMLWLSSAGKPITVHERVLIAGYIQGYLSASVEVQVQGEQPSAVGLRKVDGTWCVWL